MGRTTTMKIARFIKDVSPPGGWWVRAYLFKVTPAMKYEEHVTYRKGKLLHDERRIPHRLRTAYRSFFDKPNPIYSYGYITRTTAFVIASAADLCSMMEVSRLKMIEHAKKMLEYHQAQEVGMGTMAEEKARNIAKDKDTIALFERQEKFEVETYLFPCDKFGERKSSGEMPGSQRGTLLHQVPFQDMGYTVLGLPLTIEVVKPIEEEKEKQ
jgi:hypothetical protein